MKTKFLISFLLLIGSVFMAQAADGYCTFYTSSGYKGSKFQKETGDHYPKKWQKLPRAVKFDQGCYLEIYYVDKYNKKKKYKLTKSHSDLYKLMSGWKMKSGDYWKYVDKLKFTCAGGNNYANNTSGGGNNTSSNYESYLKKGYWVYWKDESYKGSFKTVKAGTYYPSKMGYFPTSFKIPSGFLLEVNYVNKYNKKKDYTFSSGHQDIYSVAKNWDLKDYRSAYKYVKSFRFYKEGSMNNSGGSTADRNNNSNSGSSYESYLKKGYWVYWKGEGYKSDYKYMKTGKYYPKQMGFNPASFRIPSGFLLEVTYKDKYNKEKKYTFKSGHANFYQAAKNWGMKDYRKAFQFIMYYNYRKADQANNYRTNNSGNNNSGSKGWEKYMEDGYWVYWKDNNYGGSYKYLKPGKYYPNKMGYFPSSFRLADGFLLEVYYVDKYNKKKRYTFKSGTSDFYGKAKNWGLKDYRQAAKYIQYFIYKKGSS